MIKVNELKKYGRKQRSSLVMEDGTKVVVGEEVSVAMGSRVVRARVAGVRERNEDDCFDIIAVPLNIQDVGPHFEFCLNIKEYEIAQSMAVPDIEEVAIND